MRVWDKGTKVWDERTEIQDRRTGVRTPELWMMGIDLEGWQIMTVIDEDNILGRRSQAKGVDSRGKVNGGTRELGNRQHLVDPKTGELDSEHSCLNSKREMTTRSKWKQIHVSKLHVIMDGALYEIYS